MPGLPALPCPACVRAGTLIHGSPRLQQQTPGCWSGGCTCRRCRRRWLGRRTGQAGHAWAALPAASCQLQAASYRPFRQHRTDPSPMHPAAAGSAPCLHPLREQHLGPTQLAFQRARQRWRKSRTLARVRSTAVAFGRLGRGCLIVQCLASSAGVMPRPPLFAHHAAPSSHRPPTCCPHCCSQAAAASGRGRGPPALCILRPRLSWRRPACRGRDAGWHKQQRDPPCREKLDTI